MAWRHMTLRNAKVFAKCDNEGHLEVENGKVAVHYKAGKAKRYMTYPKNLTPVEPMRLFADDHCEHQPGGATSKKKSAKSTGQGREDIPTKPEADEVLIFTDGACHKNPGPCGLGVVRLTQDSRQELSEYLGHGTNNIAELTAILRACESIEDPDQKTRIFTDSKYSMGVIAQGWNAKANKELVAQCRAAYSRLNHASLHYVKGHAGLELNERADQLAEVAVVSKVQSGWASLS